MACILIDRARLPGALTLVLLLAACGSEPVGEDTELVVSAASSLTDAFVEIEKAFESEHADNDVRLNLGGSSALREQIIEGAPADVFASATSRTWTRSWMQAKRPEPP
jgi:molybdate transport system substrate-binding protein